jgi:hypothetical protein
LELTTAAAFSLPSSAAKLLVVSSAAKLLVGVATIDSVVTRGVLIMDCGRSEIRESKAVPDRMGKKDLEAALRPGSSKEKKRGKGTSPNEEGLKRRR